MPLSSEEKHELQQLRPRIQELDTQIDALHEQVVQLGIDNKAKDKKIEKLQAECNKHKADAQKRRQEAQQYKESLEKQMTELEKIIMETE